ncbi:MAG: N-acetylneuraminate synthase family protein [Candidatus Omnitrophota bacterium]
MKKITFGKSSISQNGPCYFIAEIGHNHQGNLQTALKMIEVAAECGVNAVKFQKRDNKALYTRALYEKPYDNENSYGSTYGEHREFLEFGMAEYRELKKCAESLNVEFMSTAFDFQSADFLEELGITSYKLASGDITNTELIRYIAKFNKPMIMSTGAATLDEIRIGYEAAKSINDQICLLHCVAGYPTDYPDLNLKAIETLKQEFPGAVIGYSGHDNGILAAVIAYMLGATVVEKHFTLNRAWKGTDHKFSLEPEGLRKQVRDLRRVDIALGNSEKVLKDFEIDARKKMGKGLYAARAIEVGSLIRREDIVLKSPANDTPVYRIQECIGKRINVSLAEEAPILMDYFQ